MFFVRFLLFFAALYFSNLSADDVTKRLSHDHHAQTDHVASSPHNASRLATLAAIQKEQQSQVSCDDDQQKNLLCAKTIRSLFLLLDMIH